ncbi:MAG: rod shape-determining protein MreC, partial [Clostridia bacterium]|nr:rod shape-determining protein MreC [Clostridia bacterium]
MGNFFKSRAFIGMCIAAVLLLGLSLLSMADSGRVTVFEDLAGIIITPIQNASNRLVGASGNFVKVFTEYEDLTEENKQLKEELANAQSQLRDAEQYVVENKSLRSIIGLSEEHEDLEFAMAHVTGKELGGYSQTMTLDKGSLQGIAPKSLVITGEGIVGYISEVGATWCKVTTILDPTCEIGVLLTRSGQAAVLQGDTTLSPDGRCKASYLKNDVTLAVGDNLETSGIGGTFPGGLFVGRIKEIKSETTGLSQYAIIEPAVNIKKV